MMNVFALVTVLSALSLSPAQSPSTATAPRPQPPRFGPSPEQQAKTQADYRYLLELLNIKALRPGANGNPNAPDAANADEAKVGSYTLPDPLRFQDGKPVTNASQWRRRRAELFEAFDREVYGRVPRATPKVRWEVTETIQETIGATPAITKRLVGHVDNTSYPAISVDIQLTLTTPADAARPVPVIMELGFLFTRHPGTPAPNFAPQRSGPNWQEQVLAKGWGCAVLSPASIQADNGAGLREGIIGLCNKGRPRKPDDWGALRAWAWGASRALDYFQTDRSVDAKRVGIEGLSRYGKAALVTMAYDPRFAIAFVGSSGAGGAKLYRRNFGEKVENLASSGEYHWMAGNFVKYAGPLTPNDLPVDAHELIALCAPRPVFISCGSPQVEGNWVDSRGQFLAAVAAGPVYRLLGKKDLGATEMPPIGTALTEGDLAFRQHSGGHTTGPNWPTFLAFAARYLDPPGRASVLTRLQEVRSVDVPGNVPPLKAAFEGKFLIGTTLNYPALQGRAPMDVAIATTHFNAITPANSMKPDALQRVEGQFTFADGDRLVEIAEKSGATPIGHVLVWHEQTPAWFFQGPDGQPVSRELALARLRQHIATVVGHYKGRVKQWDVVNEAISDRPGELLRQTPWLKAIGEDYIAEAFRAAHEADPDAILIYNDYNIELAYKRPKALQLLRSLLDQKVPIHAVGIQGHWRLNTPDFAEVEKAIQQFGALGLKVMITELDIGVLPTRYQGADISVRETMTPEQQAVLNPYAAGLPDTVAQQQAERYRQAFAMFLRHPEVIGRVTLWGTQDGDSWLNNFPVRGRTDYPLLFDREGKPKPAFFAIRQAATP